MFWLNYKSPIGNMRIVSNGDALVSVDWGAAVPEKPNVVLAKAVEQLDEYFARERKEFDLPIALDGTDFQNKAWKVLQTIPYGKTVSYKQQAEKLGSAKAVRAIGFANGKNPIAVIVPCHRVIGANGSLTGYASGLEKKKFLLELEANFA